MRGREGLRAAARVPTKASRALRRVDIPVRGRRRMRKMEVEEEGWESAGRWGRGSRLWGWEKLS